MKFFLRLLFFSLFLSSLGASQLYVGPEIYSLRRWRDLGAYQKGRMDGIRAGFDRIERYGWYVGADYLWAEGTLKGEKPDSQPLQSEMKDRIWEVRGGYTFQKELSSAYFTPFIGYGAFHESNHFVYPTRVSYTSTDTFHYVSLGFLSGSHPFVFLWAGLNFKAEFMCDGKSKITGLSRGNCTLQMHKSIQFRVELPFQLFGDSFLNAQIVPFYELRHFGGREDYPHSFIDTKFQLFGVRVAAQYCF